MFGSLFEEDGSPGGVDHVLRNGKTNENGKAAIPTKPPPSRSNTNMCGIQNQGATCYLNSLLQTLLLTPEFRDGLFNLSREELGWIDSSDVSASNRKLRVIPVELQKLFSQLLLADLNAVSTTELTDSFGWVENEELQQHDVQELNRILFSAIEKSLVGTSGMDLISRLYRGTVVNQVECLKCGRVSEREESFFDLTISVSGHNALEGSLKSTYLIPEKMNGSNRYFCSHCSELVDADKRTKLRRLPPILTLSLLRFSYNPTKGERFKDTSKFSFPLRLDLTPFCDSTDADDSVNGEDIPCSNVYKLFSVVVHKGNAHGGHYHAYVRDVSCLGHWNLSVQGETGNGGCVNGENEAVDQPKSVDTSVTKEAEDKELPVPATLLRDILHRGNCIAPSGTMSLVDLCSKLSELTCGSTWKETFQSEYGRLSHFLTLHPSLFYFDKVTRTVGLQPPGDKTLTPSRARGGGADGGGGYKGGVHRRKKRKKKRGGGWVSRKPRGGAGGGSDGGRRKAGMGGLANKWRDHVGNVAASEQEDGDEDEGCESDDGENYDGDCSVSDAEEMLPEGTHWFDFDDATVKPIPASALESQYSGRESAYMLFYRREELGSGRRKGPLMPEHLGRMVEEKNMLLRKEREVYDRAVHQVYVRVLPSGAYTVRNSALHKRISVASESVEELRVPVDERWTLGLLHEEIIKACEKEPGWNMNGKCLWPELYTCMDTPCGLHLLEPLKNFRGDPDVTLVKDVYVEDFRVFAWNGKQVGGTAYNAGMDNEPLMLKLVMPSINGISHEISCGFPKSWPLSRLRVVISEMCTMPPLGLYLSYEPPKEPTSPHKYHLRRGAVGNRSNSQKLVNGSTKTESGNGEEEFTLVKPMRLSLMLNDQSLASLSIASGGKILVNSKGLFSNSSSPSESTGIVVWVEDWTHIGAKSSPLKRSPKRMSNGSELEGKESNAIQWGVGGRVVRIDASSDTTIAARLHNRLSKTGGPLQLPSQPLSQGLRAASMGAEGWSAMLRLKYFMDALSQSPALLYFPGQQFPYLINYEALLETVAQLKALAIKQLSLHPNKYRLRKMENEVVSGTHDSLCNGSVGLKCPLREELPLKEAKVESGSKIILEEGQAVEENQIWLTFSLPSGDGDTPREYEVIADKTCSVRDLLRKIVSVAQLTGEEWHIRKTRWNGDLGEPLDDPDSTVGEESLVHGDHLNLCSRSLPLRGFLRLNLYLCSRVKDLKNDSPSSDGVMHKQNGVLEHECSAINGRNGSKLIPLQFHQPPVLETASHKLQDLGCLEIDQESSLYQLKSTIMELCPAITSLGLSSPNQLRLRLLRKIDGSPKTLDNEPERMRLSRVLRNSWAHLHGGKTGRKLSESDVPSLTSLQLHSGCTVAVQVLSAEEELRPDDVVLELCHLSSTSDSPVSAELVWNSSVFNVEDNRQCNGVDMSKESINTNIVSGSYENGEVPNGQSSETPSFPCNSVPLSPPNPVSVQDENKLGLEDNENSELRPLMSFQSAVSSKLDLHQSNIILAKYISNKREWFVFHEAYQDGMQCSPGRPKKKSSNKSPSSVKTAQHCLSNLSDGDIVAVKDATCLKENEEPSDFQFFSHFLTKQTMERESGSGKKRRSVQNNGQENSCKTKEDSWDETPKRSERGIHIRVVDYS